MSLTNCMIPLLFLIFKLNLLVNICDGKKAFEISNKFLTTQASCDNTEKRLIIKGDQVKFSEFTNNKGELQHSCSAIKSVIISAVTTVIIDHDLIAAGLEVFVFAPTWEIINSRRINLDGRKHTVEPQPPEPKKGSAPGIKGGPGNPGLPGKPGGNFVGIGDEFINGEHLTVSVNGGDGQDGGYGGEGGDGENGLYVKLEATIEFLNVTWHLVLNCVVPTCYESDALLGTKNDISAISNNGTSYIFKCDVSTFKNDFSLITGWTRVCNFIVRGTTGKPSGSGGDGGAGGKSGNPGNILLMELGGKSGIKQEKNIGRAGNDGKPGKAGKPGSNGPDLHNYIKAINGFETINEMSYVNSTMENGEDGKVDYSKAKSADLAKSIISAEVANNVVEYKGQLMENLNLSDTTDFKVKFYNKITNNKDVISMMDTMALVNELKILEKNFHKLHASYDFLPLYQSLSNRTTLFAKNPKSEAQKSAEHKKVVTYLYTTIIGREYNLKDRSESNLIVDIKSYLEEAKNSIAKYKAANKITTIESYKKNYESNIKLKIEEANVLINDVIIPELEKVLKENRDNVDALINIIINLEEETKKNIQKLKGQRLEFQSKMVLAMFCDVLNVVSGFIKFIPKVGAIASDLITTGVGILDEAYGLSKEEKIPAPSGLPEGAKHANQFTQDYRSKAKSELSELIEFSIEHLSEYPDLVTEIKDIKYKLDKVTDVAGILQLREKLVQVVYSKPDDSRFMNTNKRAVSHLSSTSEITISSTSRGQDTNYEISHKGNDTVNKNDTVIENDTPKGNDTIKDKDEDKFDKKGFVSHVIQSKALFGMVKNVLARKGKLDEFNRAIEKEEETLKQLEQYQDNVQKKMGPALEMMSNDVLNVANSLGGESQASLDVTKWQLQTKLKDMNAGVQGMVKGLNVSERFTQTFRRIEDAINTLVSLYDRIQSYQDEQKLSNYIADINSADSNSIRVSNEKLQSAINYLDLILNCNQVIQQYQTAVDAFKQYVFPFANLFFQELVLPSFLNYGEDLSGLVMKAETQINHIAKKINEYRMTAKRYHSYIGSGQFNSKYRSTQPFFVWDKQTYGDMISQLLSGEKVLAFADVKKSFPRYDAIKFTEIEINIKANDKTTQTIINNVLKDFEIGAFHLGNSYFRSQEQFYLLTTGKLEFWYGFERDRNGQLLKQSVVNDKIKNGDAMLSPYATWLLHITHNSEHNPQAFVVLKKYKKLVDIELIGRGHYINKPKLDIDIKIDQYYTPVESNNQTRP